MMNETRIQPLWRRQFLPLFIPIAMILLAYNPHDIYSNQGLATSVGTIMMGIILGSWAFDQFSAKSDKPLLMLTAGFTGLISGALIGGFSAWAIFGLWHGI